MASTLLEIPPEWTILGTWPPIRILSSVPEIQRQMDCRIWSEAIIKISEHFVDILQIEGPSAFIPPPGRPFIAGPVSLLVAPSFGTHHRFFYLTLSTVVSEIWQVVLADGCRTYNFEIMIGKGQGMKEGDHIGTIEILYPKTRRTAVARARLKQ